MPKRKAKKKTDEVVQPTTMTKKKKLNDKTTENANLPLLPLDVLSVILSMLQPRELISFASTSKSIMKLVTHKHVIRGGVVMQKLKGSSHTNTELSNTMQLIQDRVIFIPSPMRLLRLVLGTKCERCHTTNCPMQAGIYLCGQCTHDTAFRALNPPSHLPRRSHLDGSISRPYYSRGERCGPVVTLTDMLDMAWNGKSMEDYLKIHCPNDDTIQNLLDFHKDALESYKCIDEERELKQQQAKAKLEEKKRAVQAQRDARSNRKRAAMLATLEQLCELIDERWRATAMEYTWDDDDFYNQPSSPKFTSDFVHSRIVPFMRAPSKVTKTGIRALAEEINQEFLSYIWNANVFLDASDDEPDVIDLSEDSDDEPRGALARLINLLEDSSSDDDEEDSICSGRHLEEDSSSDDDEDDDMFADSSDAHSGDDEDDEEGTYGLAEPRNLMCRPPCSIDPRYLALLGRGGDESDGDDDDESDHRSVQFVVGQKTLRRPPDDSDDEDTEDEYNEDNHHPPRRRRSALMRG